MTKILHVSTRHHEMWKGPKRYIRIFLYDNVGELRNAARKEHYNTTDQEPDRVVGMFTPAPKRLFYAKDGSETDRTDPHWAGIMRLCRDHLTYEVISHECVHAACSIWRMDVLKTVNLGWACFEREEQFAYLVGNLTDEVMWKLRHYI